MSQNTDRLSTALADRYRIVRHLGEGGMATVYLAEDLKHDRKVAVKVLRPELAAVLGAERFVQEIKTTASLQHPHILPLFDSGRARVPPLRGAERGTGGEAPGQEFLFYVMPYVEGETLRDKLNRETQLSIEEAVRITTEVADALDYAHRHDVIHRDIKPENILLHDGRAMVADFGIALAISAAAGGRMTETGLSLGTPHYMSPEQATAEKDLTSRSDVYSLGAMLYEMLSGEPPHLGNSAQQIIMKIVTDVPRPVTELRKSVPSHVAAAVAKSLEKLAADRFSSTAEFAAALGDPSFGHGTVAAASHPHHRSSRRPTVILLSVLAAAALGWLVGRGGAATDQARLVTRFVVPVSPPLDLDWNVPVTVSPDGRTFIYKAGGMLYQRRLDAFEAEPLIGTQGANKPTYSPDGAWIAFAQNSRIRKMSSAGGPVTEVAPIRVGVSPLGLDWGDGDEIVFTRGLGHLGIWRIPAAGGEVERLTTVQDSLLETAHGWPQALPGGQRLLFTVIGPSGGPDDAALVIKDLRTGERHRVMEHTNFGRYVEPGYLIFTNAAGTALVAPIDLDDYTVGTAVAVEPNLRTAWWGGWTSFDVTAGGTAVFVQGAPWADYLLWRVDRQGNRLEQIGPASTMHYLALSPDGGHLAMTLRTADNSDIHVLDLATEETQRISFDVAEDESPVWSPDGQRIAYSSAWTGQARRIYVKDVRGGEPSLLYTGDRHIHLSDWSTDGRWLAFDQYDLENQQDVYALRIDSTEQLVPVAVGPALETGAVFSPDGRWIAYSAADQGAAQVFVRSFPEGSATYQVSTAGGVRPQWSRAGELFFWQDTSLLATRVTTGETFTWTPPRRLFDAPDVWRFFTDYAVAANGQEFILQVVNPDATLDEIHVVENWLDEVRATVPR